MALICVAEARSRILADAEPVATEIVDLMACDGRVLAGPVAARRTQPPFDTSAMDGYAVRRSDVAQLPARLDVVGEAAAGRGYDGAVEPGQAVRIFTGAPVPDAADAVVIQENTERDGDHVVVTMGAPERGHIRKRGIDFETGAELFDAGRRLTPRDVTLAAAMGHDSLSVRRKPVVALLATGDELVLPGQPVGRDQIVCSNPFGISAMVERAGGAAQFLGIAPDTREDLSAMCSRARDADILVTIGGASVGDHDLVGPVLRDMGMELDFWRIAMRPGKPLMFGRLDRTFVIGLPGNPVSSLICSRIFLLPLISALLGCASEPDLTEVAAAAVAMDKNGPREHYMRATVEHDQDGTRHVRPIASQDSSLLAPLAGADVLIVRPANDPPVAAGDSVRIMRLDF